jgi:hypothetical protein
MRVLAWAGLFTCQIATSEPVSVSITAVSTYVHKCLLANHTNSSKHVSLCPSSALPMPSLVANWLLAELYRALGGRLEQRSKSDLLDKLRHLHRRCHFQPRQIP